MNDERTAKVSVVIPCYKCAHTIERAITSVYQQTLRPAEVIVIDDCSGDSTLDVLYALQRLYPRGWLKVISLKRNSGPGDARNAGWEVASQPYVAFLDADDSWHPQKIEIQYRWMMEHPDVALTGHECVQLKDDNVRHIVFPQNAVPARPVPKFRILFRSQFSTRSVMLRRDIVQRFAKNKRHSEDYLLWLEIVCSGQRAYKIDLPLAYLYKAPYGEGGLSAQMWKMAKGELDTYRRLLRSDCIPYLVYLVLCAWSWMRYVRRLLLLMLRS